MAASAKVVFEGDDSSMSAAMLRVQNQLLALQRRVVTVFSSLRILKTAAGFVSSEFGKMREVMEQGAEFDVMHAQTGIAVRDLVALKKEFKAGGKQAEEIAPAIAKMLQHIGDGKAASVIRAMGLDMDQLKRKTPVEQFHLLGDAIAKIPSQMERVEAARAIFGREGASLLAVFAGEGFGKMSAAMSAKAAILEKDAGLFHHITIKLSEAGERTKGFFLGVADKVAPILKPLLDRFASMDLSKMGQQIGNFIALLVQSFADGSIWTILATSAQIALSNALNFLAGGLLAVVGALWQSLKEIVKDVVMWLGIITKADFWKGMGNALLGIAKDFVAIILNGIAAMLDKMSKIPGIGKKAADGAASLRAKADELRKSGDENLSRGKDLLSPFGQQIGNRFIDQWKSIFAAGAQGWEKGSGLIDTSNMQKKLDQSIEGLFKRTEEVSKKSLSESPGMQANPTGELMLHEDKMPASHLHKIGLDNGPGGASDPAQAARKKTNSLIEMTNKKLDKIIEKSGHTTVKLPVFS